MGAAIGVAAGQRDGRVLVLYLDKGRDHREELAELFRELPTWALAEIKNGVDRLILQRALSGESKRQSRPVTPSRRSKPRDRK